MQEQPGKTAAAQAGNKARVQAAPSALSDLPPATDLAVSASLPLADAGADTAPDRAPGTAPRRRLRLGIWGLLALPFLALLLVLGFLVLTHRPVPVPRPLVAAVEARANALLAGRVSVTAMGGADLILEDGFVPRVLLRGLRIARPSGAPIAVLPELRLSFWPEPLLRGKAVPRAFSMDGATVVLRRLEDGRFDLDLGGAGALQGMSFSHVGEVTQAVEAAFDTPALRYLERATAERVHIRIDDRRLDRIWEVSDGHFELLQDGSRIAVTLNFGVGEEDREPAQIALSATTSKSGPEAEFVAAVTDVPARDLAMQSPAVALLGLLDAPISGSLRSGIDATGALSRMDATLSVGAGALSPAEGAPPVPFDSARMRLSYDPGPQKVTMSEASFQSRALRFRASGQSYLRDFDNGLPREALVQMNLTGIEADPEGVFIAPARFSFGAVEARLRLDPFRVDVGQLQLQEGESRISGKGAFSAARDGWRIAFDAGVDSINQHDLLALWPPRLVPPTRHWLSENVVTGQLKNARAAVRIAPGEVPRFELGYEFRGAEVTVLNTLPPVKEGRGFATIHDNSHTLMVEEGSIDAPGAGQAAGRVEVADSVMKVPDIREKPALAQISLVTRGPIPAALALLDQPPFRFLSKAGKTPDIAQGWAEARSDLSFRMVKKVDAKDVDFNVVARLSDVRSDRVVRGRVIAAPELTLRADRRGMTISGKGKLDAVPFDARWSQMFGPEHRGTSTAEGYVNVTPGALQSLGVNLPAGMLGGSGWGRIDVALQEGAPGRYRFETDLKGLALKVPEIGWSKAGAAQGKLTLAGQLSQPPTVENFALNAPGLRTEGRLTLGKSGLERAVFERAQIGTWFEGAADLIGKGPGRAPDVQIRKGRLDLRRAPFGKTAADAAAAGGGRGGAAGTSRIEAALDRLIVSDTIALTGLRGSFTSRGGIAGDFAARLNGGAQLEGVIGPAANGRSAVRILAPDAGAVLASAGIFGRAGGGRLTLDLSPVGRESYEGRAHVSGLRLRDAPILASLLSAASIVGLLEQLNGEGILFSDVDAAFRMTPSGISVTRGEATGASMGITLAGNYFPKTATLDMEGVFSPLYILNSLGQIFARKGEGLFGFTYTLQGPAKTPSISVNPFSILTPGAIRDLFRRTPPEVKTE